MKRKEADLLREPFYYTGEPCVRGHVSMRRTSNGVCLRCEELRTKQWRRENRDRVSVYNTRQPRGATFDRYANGEHYATWCRLFASFDVETSCHYIMTAKNPVVTKAAIDTFGVPINDGESSLHFRERLCAVLSGKTLK